MHGATDAGALTAARYAIDPARTRVAFGGRLFGVTVRGTIGVTGGEIVHGGRSPDDLLAVRAELDATSVRTGLALRDRHLRSRDYLHARRYPAIVFDGTHVDADGEARVLWGRLTMHGVTRPVGLALGPLPTVDPGGWPDALQGSASARLSRGEFGVGVPGHAWRLDLRLLDDEVDVRLSVGATFLGVVRRGG